MKKAQGLYDTFGCKKNMFWRTSSGRNINENKITESIISNKKYFRIKLVILFDI